MINLEGIGMYPSNIARVVNAMDPGEYCEQVSA